MGSGQECRQRKKHGVSFGSAIQIFDGLVLTAVDDRLDYGELRSISTGQTNGGAALTVVHTDRVGSRRIISARHFGKTGLEPGKETL